jgi:hypothetical protein
MSKRTTRTLSRIRETAADMNYAQRRVVEIRLAIPPQEHRYTSIERPEIQELEAVYELEPAIVESENPA